MFARKPIDEVLTGSTFVLVIFGDVAKLPAAEFTLGALARGIRLGHVGDDARLIAGEDLFTRIVSPDRPRPEACDAGRAQLPTSPAWPSSPAAADRYLNS